jgi:hypothetical protein
MIFKTCFLTQYSYKYWVIYLIKRKKYEKN